MTVYLSVQQTRDFDKHAIEVLGIPGEQLMENAGRGVAEYIIKKHQKNNYKKVLIVCGKGNNGGDGLVIARLLSENNYLVKTIMVADLKKIDNKLFSSCDLIIDAIFGTGLNGPVSGIYGEAIQKMNDSTKPIVSVDIPSGINGDSGPTSSVYIKPVATITFVAKKGAMRDQPKLFGDIKVIDIGVPLVLK